MDKHEFGAFLRSRRERLRPEDVGLPSGSRRRTPGLRREEVAVLAHISTEYYVRLEQGRAPRPSGEVLAGIGGALRLTDAEFDHLHVLAGTAPIRTGLHRRDVRPSILALLERLPQTAAFVTSAAFEVLAWNDLAAALMENFAELAPEDRNLARRAFLGPARAGATLYGVSDAAEFRHHVVMGLRSTLARYPTDLAVTELIEELRDGSPEFVRLWERHDVQAGVRRRYAASRETTRRLSSSRARAGSRCRTRCIARLVRLDSQWIRPGGGSPQERKSCRWSARSLPGRLRGIGLSG
ncbi:helix-turn-helix protein [Streptomyces sp. 3212.3]|uniref:helix-turn-helix transcriptional regulator n=1 Tax=Streptomyces sp. 3212.3 TaxID=1938846 RepID=UPI000E3AE198|nr:helix-turn-helix transcriptional regulator [Streptomyces sp. 3212.3]REE58087.1 helix-turn-helix protein [Streptomyces sp. 3212.3]